jgi:peptidoglycan hydrolase-like protein with peptidoglycan-binding domain
VTWLPAEGAVVDRGQTLYGVAGRPIPLLIGDQPFGRQLAQGVSGHDVQELEQNLITLGDGAGLVADGKFAAADAAAVSRWQRSLGVPATGVVNPGDAVVLPGPVRVEQLKTGLGASIQASAPVMAATSMDRVVNVNLDANLQSLAHAGDPVEVTLPDGGRTVTGKVISVAQVATPTQPSAQPSSSGTGAPAATVAVTIGLDDPSAAGSLDQAPVTVSIISRSAKNALTVPISALLAQQDGGYAVEVADGTAGTRMVPVQTGLFDDQDSLVQVSSPDLREGQRVVVPSLS